MTVVVLGAGAVGVATAWYLAKAGQDVVVVERQNAAALETSWGNGFVIHASEAEPWSQPGMPSKILGWLGKEDAPLLLRYSAIPKMWRWGLDFARNCTPDRFRAHAIANLELALHSLRSIQEIDQQHGFAYDRATRGVMKIFRNMASLDAAERSCMEFARHGLLHERLHVERAVELEPALAETASTLAGALYFSRDEVGDCNKFTQALAKNCEVLGVKFHYSTNVLGVLASQQRRVTGVRTDKGTIAAEQVVVAMGSFSAPLLRTLGLRVPIYPVKGVSITFDREEWSGAPSMPVIDDSKLFGLVPVGNRMRISGSAEIAHYDATPTPERAAAIVANTTFTFPSLKEHYDPSKSIIWGGLRPVTPTGNPLIGRSALEGLWLNSGHGHLGWTLACGSGRLLADLMVGKNTGLQQTSLNAFAPRTRS